MRDLRHNSTKPFIFIDMNGFFYDLTDTISQSWYRHKRTYVAFSIIFVLCTIAGIVFQHRFYASNVYVIVNIFIDTVNFSGFFSLFWYFLKLMLGFSLVLALLCLHRYLIYAHYAVIAFRALFFGFAAVVLGGIVGPVSIIIIVLVLLPESLVLFALCTFFHIHALDFYSGSRSFCFENFRSLFVAALIVSVLYALLQTLLITVFIRSIIML